VLIGTDTLQEPLLSTRRFDCLPEIARQLRQLLKLSRGTVRWASHMSM